MPFTKVVLPFRLLFFTLCFFCCLTAFSQQRITSKYAKPTAAQLRMTSYPLDPEADAVVLYERGDYRFELIENRVMLVKNVYRKIKVLDAANFEGGEVQIFLYKGEKSAEILSRIRGITQNGIMKKEVQKSEIFYTEISDRYRVASFAFPNVQDGSILEYHYRIESPFYFQIGDWNFQGKYPKIYSEFVAEIPYNYRYNRLLLGSRKLYINEAQTNVSCIQIPSYRYTDADCEYNIYAMKDIPAYREEPYMLSVDNYISKLRHELRDVVSISGDKTSYSKTWEDVDKEYEDEKTIGKQLKYVSFFKNKLPDSIFGIKDLQQRTKAVYTFIQNHFTWNEKYKIFSDVDVKKAFGQKSGNNTEINLALIDALKAANIPAELALISTRDNDLPTLAYPVLTDFNMTLAAVKINDQFVFLDATDKDTPFGMLPFRDLNVYARIMDFENGSYWETINPYPDNLSVYRSQITVNDLGEINGEVNESYKGYLALSARRFINQNSQNDIATQLNSFVTDVEVTDAQVTHLKKIDQPLQLSYGFEAEMEDLGNQYLINPLAYNKLFDGNPFESNGRLYPIDMGFPVSYTQLISVKIDPSYTVASLPENVSKTLSNNDGSFRVAYTQNENTVLIRMTFKLTGFQFEPERAQELKEMFQTIIDTQNDAQIMLTKKG